MNREEKNGVRSAARTADGSKRSTQTLPRALKIFLWALPLAFVFSQTASAEAVGYLSYDVISPGSQAAFDIFNGTGSNSSGDPTFPVTTFVNFSSLSLMVDFSDGSKVTEPASYFSLASDGQSWNGTPIGIGGASPQPTEAILTGSFSPTMVTLFNGTKETIAPTFSVTLLPSSGTKLADGDLVVISAVPSTGTVPEPSTGFLVTGALALLCISRRQYVREILGRLRSFMRAAALPLVLAIGCSVLISQANAATVNLGGSTLPSSGTVGTNVNVTVTTGWPSGDTTPGNIVITWAGTCGGAVSASNTANSLRTVIGSSERVGVTIPTSLATGTYFVSVSDSAGADTDFTSSNCSEVQVTGSSTGLASCVPASSLGVVAPLTGPASVYAYVPNGAWSNSTTGMEIVQVETGGGSPVAPVAVPTGTDAVNSCAGNPVTGEALCTANSTHVFHIGPPPANTVTTLTSGANSSAGFSGGSCMNCGVAINTLNNQAVITEGFTPSGSNSALQVLNLATNTFNPPFAVAHEVSENIQVDPFDSVILSANEASVFDLVAFNSSGALTTEYAQSINTPSTLELDSSAMDCSTRIGVAPGEFSNTFVLTDLTQAKYTAGTPGSWTAPYSETTIIGSYSAGLSGSAIAPGVNHLGVVTGEFGGSSFAVLKLPATSGSGTPALVDYAYVPCVNGMSAGTDPHTLTAYVSPNNGKSYGLFSNFSTSPPNLLQADLAGILALTRAADGHTVVTDTGGCLNPAGPIGGTVLKNIASH